MAAPQQYSGKGFILGGVTDDTPDWLGSYNEGVEAAQQQQTTRLNQQETRQRMGENAAAEARRATEFANQQAERARMEEAWASQSGLPGLQTPQGPALGPMPALDIPAAQAPSPKYADELAPATPGLDTGNNGAITRDQFIQMLPEWARMEQAEGLPPNYLETISMLESSGGTNTGTGRKYTGIFQVGPEVAADFGVTPEQLRDPRINAQVAAKLAGRNARQLREVLGREPQPWEIYLAHQQGVGGAMALLQNPNMSAVDALTIAYRGDRSKAQQAVVQNGGDPTMTAAQFAGLWAQKFGGALPQPFTGQPGGAEKDMPIIPGLSSKATRTGRTMLSETARTPLGVRTSLPEGTLDMAAAPPTAAAQTDAAAQTPPEAVTPGLQTQPATDEQFVTAARSIASDLVPSVSQADYAGVTAPGQGSIAQQIMRTPAGQRTALPDSGLYIAEPARINADLNELMTARQMLERRYNDAMRFRDRQTMLDIEGKAVETDAAIRLLQNMQSIAALQGGDVNQISQTLSRITGGQTRIQPRSDGTYNIYQNGQLAYEAVPKEALIASLRSQFDQQYQAMVAERVKQANAMETEQFKQASETNREVVKRQADTYKELAIKRAEQQYNSDPRNQEYSASTQTGADGNPILFLTPKRGGGAPQIWTLEPDIGVDGQPLVDQSGNPKLSWKQQSTGGISAVPVQ